MPMTIRPKPRTKTKATKSRSRIAGMTYAYIQLPAAMHEAMKAVRQARWELEGVDPKLCRIYQEAVKLYLQAKPQRQLLDGRTARATA